MLMAVAVAMTVTAMVSLTAQSPQGVTAALYPIVPGLDLLAIMACMYRATLRRRVLHAVIVGAVAVPGLAWFLHPGSRPVLNLGQLLVWPICSLICAWRYRRELDTAVKRHAEDVAVDDEAARAQAFLDGRFEVLTLAGRAVEDAHSRLDELESLLGPNMREHVQRALQEVDRRLHALLHNGDESPSSTTTPSLATATPPP